MEPDPSAPRRVEAYLDQILAPLAHRLSPFHQDELRRELREHLLARVEAYIELGHTEDDAVTEALQQFGGAENFIQQWQSEWLKMPPRVTWPEVWQATRLALPFSLSALLLACLPSLLQFAHYEIYANRDGSDSWYDSYNITFHHISLCLCFMPPVALGVLVGRREGNSAALGVLAALTVGCLFGCLINVIGGYLWEQAIMFRECIDNVARLAVMWMPIACTTVWLTNKWTRRLQVSRLA